MLTYFKIKEDKVSRLLIVLELQQNVYMYISQMLILLFFIHWGPQNITVFSLCTIWEFKGTLTARTCFQFYLQTYTLFAVRSAGAAFFRYAYRSEHGYLECSIQMSLC
jgi:hypothetical protein